MPRLGTHVQVSVPAGVASGWWFSEGQDPAFRILEAAGAGVGGALGGVLPDCIDLPIHSHHRSGAHGIVPAIGLGTIAFQQAARAQDWLRAQADVHAQARAVATSVVGEIWHLFCEAVLRLLAGAVVGLPTGYASHLALDFFTPRSLPLVC
jgi:hypothetical protein